MGVGEEMTTEKTKPDELDILERMIDEEIRQRNAEILRQQSSITTLQSVKNDIKTVRQRFHSPVVVED